MVPPQTGQFQRDEDDPLQSMLAQLTTVLDSGASRSRVAGCGAVAVGEEAKVTDADEAAWQQVQQEAAQELLDRQGHEPFLVAMG